MKIDGIEVNERVSTWDGKPIKNWLPVELRERLKTQNQWLELGFVLKSDATCYEMHPSVLAKKLCTYYLDTDVERISVETSLRNCLTCSIRNGRFCVVAGDYVGYRNCCSEWTPKDH